jgi:FixJ family two-component response regulator
MNGKELMLKVQEMIPNPPPFLFMSGDVYMSSDPVISKGAKAILPKPFDVRQVRDLVGSAFSA